MILHAFLSRAAYRALVSHRAGKLGCKTLMPQLRRPPEAPTTSFSANCIPEIDTEITELGLPSTSVLSLMGENIAGYIAGYIGRQLMKRLTCVSCKEALAGPCQTVRLAQIKDRGGLFSPSADLCRCVHLCELRRRCIALATFDCQTADALLASSVRGAVSQGIFASLSCLHGSDESHRYFLIRSICEKYLFVRLANKVRSFNMAAKNSVRQLLNKKILFLGQ